MWVRVRCFRGLTGIWGRSNDQQKTKYGGFSTALLVKAANSFGLNDDFSLGRKGERANLAATIGGSAGLGCGVRCRSRFEVGPRGGWR